MKKIFSTSIIVIIGLSTLFGQNCVDFKDTVSDDYSYNNETEDFSLPLNDTWEIIFENQKAILASLSNNSREGGVSVLKNKNGFIISSAHEIPEEINSQLFTKIGFLEPIKVVSKTFLKNLKVLQIEFEYKVKNLDDTYLMSGLIYEIIKDGNTFVFLFTCPQNKKVCYIPFYKSVMKNAYFGQTWY
jgi:hypothetical protein